MVERPHNLVATHQNSVNELVDFDKVKIKQRVDANRCSEWPQTSCYTLNRQFDFIAVVINYWM